MLMKSLKERMPKEMLEFIELDVNGFMKSFFPGTSYDTGGLRFETLTNRPYDHYLLVPLSQKKASELTEPAFKAWGIEMSEKAAKLIDACNNDDHNGHEYMLPFYKTNSELMAYYTHMMSSPDVTTLKQEAIRHDFTKLQEVKDSDSHDAHFETKFHCLGDAFNYKQYRETDWAARLFYSIKDKLPSNTTVHPSYKYHNNFGALQQMFSSNSSAMKFFFLSEYS